MADYWTEKYNAQSDEIRTIGQIMWAKTMINGLKREKHRIKARYDQSFREINSHIKNLEELIPPPPEAQ